MSLMLMIGQYPDCAASLNIEQLIQEKMDLAQFFRMDQYKKIFVVNPTGT